MDPTTSSARPTRGRPFSLAVLVVSMLVGQALVVWGFTALVAPVLE